VGGMEVAEVRGFVGGVVDGLRYVLLSFVSCLCWWWRLLGGCSLLTASLTGRSAARGKRLGESVKLKSGRMDLVAVLTLTRMMTICNYNVQFPFRSPEALPLALLFSMVTWLQRDEIVRGHSQHL
jgi:hypothetical protein